MVILEALVDDADHYACSVEGGVESGSGVEGIDFGELTHAVEEGCVLLRLGDVDHVGSLGEGGDELGGQGSNEALVGDDVGSIALGLEIVGHGVGVLSDVDDDVVEGCGGGEDGALCG